MNDAIIVQQADAAGAPLLLITHELHVRYAHEHNMDFLPVYRDSEPGHVYGWSRWHMLSWALDRYEWVFWVDADAAIVGTSDLRLASDKPVGLRWGQAGTEPAHYNVGVMYLHATPGVRHLARIMLFEAPDGRHKPQGAWYGESGHQWCDQKHINELAKQPQWADLFGSVDDRWNSIWRYSQTDDAVVMAWHGGTTMSDKRNHMILARDRGWSW